MALPCSVLSGQPSFGANAGSAAPLPWGAKEKPQDHQILRLFIGDITVSVSIDHDVINRA